MVCDCEFIYRKGIGERQNYGGFLCRVSLLSLGLHGGAYKYMVRFMAARVQDRFVSLWCAHKMMPHGTI